MKQRDIFGEDLLKPEHGFASSLQSDGKALRLVKPHIKLTPRQQQFNRQLAKIDKLQRDLDQLQALGTEFSARFSKILSPLYAQLAAARRG